MLRLTTAKTIVISKMNFMSVGWLKIFSQSRVRSAMWLSNTLKFLHPTFSMTLIFLNQEDISIIQIKPENGCYL